VVKQSRARKQRLAGGLGIMLDDVLAGLYTLILIHIGRAIFGLR
jgi:phosphatidylglycerophosphatase A